MSGWEAPASARETPEPVDFPDEPQAPEPPDERPIAPIDDPRGRREEPLAVP
jgi:hypothetical protein